MHGWVLSKHVPAAAPGFDNRSDLKDHDSCPSTAEVSRGSSSESIFVMNRRVVGEPTSLGPPGGVQGNDVGSEHLSSSVRQGQQKRAGIIGASPQSECDPMHIDFKDCMRALEVRLRRDMAERCATLESLVMRERNATHERVCLDIQQHLAPIVTQVDRMDHEITSWREKVLSAACARVAESRVPVSHTFRDFPGHQHEFSVSERCVIDRTLHSKVLSDGCSGPYVCWPADAAALCEGAPLTFTEPSLEGRPFINTDGFEGHWIAQGLAVVVDGTRVSWGADSKGTLASIGRHCIMQLEGKVYKGELAADDQLHWDDGEIWHRALAPGIGFGGLSGPPST